MGASGVVAGGEVVGVADELKDPRGEAQRLLLEAEEELRKTEPDWKRFKELNELSWSWARLADPARY